MINVSIWPRDGIKTGTTNPGERETMSNGNEKVLYTSQCSRTGALSSNAVYCPTQDTSPTHLTGGTLTSATTKRKSGPGSNGNEGGLQIPQNSRTWALTYTL